MINNCFLDVYKTPESLFKKGKSKSISFEPPFNLTSGMQFLIIKAIKRDFSYLLKFTSTNTINRIVNFIWEIIFGLEKINQIKANFLYKNINENSTK